MAWAAPTSKATGTLITAAIWLQDVVDNPIALRAGGIAIASQAALDFVYGSSATQLGRLAAGSALQAPRINSAGTAWEFATLVTPKSLCAGRLTLTTALPVTTADVTAATTVYWALYGGNQVALYTGAAWTVVEVAELSIAVPGTTNTMYDAFVDYNAGTPVLAVTAWTNDTTRATALTKQDGVLVQTGNLDWRYVGSFRTTGVSGQTEDSYLRRLVWNYYHRKKRPLRMAPATDGWEYSTATIRQAEGSTANQVDGVIGVAEDAVVLQNHMSARSSVIDDQVVISIGQDATNAIATGAFSALAKTAVAGVNVSWTATYTAIPAAGYHYWPMLEYANAAGTVTWIGDNGAPTIVQNGLVGWVLG